TSMTYAFDNAWQHARERLALLEQCLDPSTRSRIKSLGVADGWQCLEAGAGGGSVAQWLCRQVGAAGRVVSTDIDTRFHEHIHEPNLDITKLDLTTDSIPQNTFDLVHTRMVLMHLPSRADILEKLVAALKPGGWLLVEEQDVYPVLATASGPYRRGLSPLVGSMGARRGGGRRARAPPRPRGRRGRPAVSGGGEAGVFSSGAWPGDV